MKLLKFLFSFLFVFYVTNIYAQEYYTLHEGISGDYSYKTSFKKNKQQDNWFLQIGVATNVLLGDDNGGVAFGERLGHQGNIAVGKWYNPYIGSRLKFEYGLLKNFEYKCDPGAYYLRDLPYQNIQLDFMWDFTNYFSHYNENKLVSVIPYVGAGYAFRSEKVYDDGRIIKRSESPSLNLGILIPLKLNKRVDLFLDGQYTILNEQFNRADKYHEEDRIISASVGLSFKLGKTNFDSFESIDYDLLNDLNKEINELRKRPKSCPECPAPDIQIIEVEKEKIIMYKSVIFKLNSYIINKNQLPNIFEIAEYSINNNIPIRITGYADRETGDSSYNLKLSEKRAKAVAKVLHEKYNVPEKNIIIDWYGDEIQPYVVNEWNRLVILEVEGEEDEKLIAQ
jgi:outer membrane protein OmpA-like peptidoglycan-associated protein